MKHGYDYIDGKISFDRKSGGVGKAGDLGDEVRGFKREIALGAEWGKDISLPRVTKDKVKNQVDNTGNRSYSSLPSEDIDINTPGLNLKKDAYYVKP